LALYPLELLIFPRSSSQSATARVKMTGQKIEAAFDVEDLTFKLVKKNKTTLYVKVSYVTQ
jgi:hypothetical protein